MTKVFTAKWQVSKWPVNQCPLAKSSKEIVVHILVVWFLTQGIFSYLLHNLTYTYLHILHSLLFDYCNTRSKLFWFWGIIDRSGLAPYNDISLIHFMFMYIYHYTRRFMAEILPIRRKTLYNQSIITIIELWFFYLNRECMYVRFSNSKVKLHGYPLWFLKKYRHISSLAI